MKPEDLVFATVMLPLLGSALALTAKSFRNKRVSTAIEYLGACIGLLVPLAVLVRLFPFVEKGGAITGVVGSWYAGIGISFKFDGLALLINVLGYTVGIAAWIYSLGAGPRGPVFTGVFLIQSAALSATIMTNDLFNLFVCLEIMGMTSYVLIPTSRKPGASLAAFSYLMVSASAMVFFLLGTYGFYRLTGSLSFEGIELGLRAIDGSQRLLSLACLSLLVSAVAIRVAVMPLYGWLPDAHALSPHAVSAVLSGVLIKTPLFALARILHMLPEGTRVGALISVAGALTAIIAVIIALSQQDAKRLLAYHSISQIGYVVAAWGMALSHGIDTPKGSLFLTAAFLHAFYHALFKGLLFLSVGTTIDVADGRNVYRLRSSIAILRARGERIPVTFITFLVGALAISAIPPFNGYVSKNAISYALKGTFHHHLLSAAAIGTVASFIKLSRIYWPAREQGTAVLREHTKTDDSPYWPRLTAQLVLAALCVATGLASGQILPLVGSLLAPEGTNAIHFPPLLSPDNLMKTAWTVAAGIVCFFIATSKAGSTVLRVVRNRPRAFHGLFVSFCMGTAGLAAYLLL